MSVRPSVRPSVPNFLYWYWLLCYRIVFGTTFWRFFHFSPKMHFWLVFGIFGPKNSQFLWFSHGLCGEVAGQIWLVLGLWLLCKHISRPFSHFFEKLLFLAFWGLRNFNFGQFQPFLIDLLKIAVKSYCSTVIVQRLRLAGILRKTLEVEHGAMSTLLFMTLQCLRHILSHHFWAIPLIQCGPIWFSGDLEWFMAHFGSF